MQINRTFGLFATTGLLALGCASANEQADPDATPVLTDSLGAELSPVSESDIIANEAVERNWNLLLRVQTRPGHLFEVYEPSPGMLVYSGSGSRETSVPSPALTEAERNAPAITAALRKLTSSEADASAADHSSFGQSLVEVLARVAPRSLELPEVEAAVQRERERLEARGVEPPGPSLAEARQVVREILAESALQTSDVQADFQLPVHTRGTAYSGGFCDEGYFNDTSTSYPLLRTLSACPSGASTYHFDERHCLDDYSGYPMSRNNGDSYYGLTNVCAATGSVTLGVKVEEDESSWTVQQNYYRWVRVSDPNCSLPFNDCPYFRSMVYDTQKGERWHYRFLVDVDD